MTKTKITWRLFKTVQEIQILLMIQIEKNGYLINGDSDIGGIVMLVTLWWLLIWDLGGIIIMLATFPLFWWFSHCIKSSPTSQTCHQHLVSTIRHQHRCNRHGPVMPGLSENLPFDLISGFYLELEDQGPRTGLFASARLYRPVQFRRGPTKISHKTQNLCSL